MREFIDGATAIARAAIAAKCDFFAGYPISPATPLLLHMIRELPKVGGVAIQAEDEIASICMCIGAAMTGARALTATSGPGISLFSENLGLAIMGEVPLVIVDAQRLGPATGGATTPSQGDVQFVRWGTSGGYPIIALAPGTAAECYCLTLRAFDLSERFRTPVFLLTDKETFLTHSAVDAAGYQTPAVRSRRTPTSATPAQAGQEYLPWRFEPMDLPPAFSPIGGEHLIRFTGSSHDERGFLTKDPTLVGHLNEHLWRKIEDHRCEIEMSKQDLDTDAETLFVSYGVTSGAMAEALAVGRRAGLSVSAFTPLTIWPVPAASLLAAVQKHRRLQRIVVAELNLGDFRREVERVVYGWAAGQRVAAPEIMGINRLDGELITPDQILGACR